MVPKGDFRLRTPPPSTQPQSGNALFLILIAVALFAALSYAVTQSGRGGGATTNEDNALKAAQITQWGALARQAATRMILTGTPAQSIDLCFNGASSVCLSLNTGVLRPCSTGAACLFAPDGGGVPIHPPNLALGATGFGLYEAGANVAIEGVGTTAGEVLMAAAVTQQVCEQINRQLGLSVPVLHDANNSVAVNQTLDDIEDGESIQCAQDSTATYFYLHTLAER